MTYKQAVEYLFTQIPAFERQGAGGYKPGLDTARRLDDATGNPHRRYRCIHVAGTNGKGSVANLLAATLQSAGYRVGMFTSPHLVDFRERIRVNGKMISEQDVVRFVEWFHASELECKPSFFELTTAMALEHFAREAVDFAVIEVGLGGRLDSTNIITPVLSIITNISLDHTQFLGNTLAEVAGEKAGIIKPRVPVVIGNASDTSVREVFEGKAGDGGSPIIFAQEQAVETEGITCQLTGDYQAENLATALCAIAELRRQGVDISDEAVRNGFAHVCEITGFFARWTTLGRNPLVVCDAGHNCGAWTMLRRQLANLECERLHMVIGFAADKSVDEILGMMPADAVYYFTQAGTPRAMNAVTLQQLGAQHRLQGECYDNVGAAMQAAMQAAAPADAIFAGGSFYVLGELLAHINPEFARLNKK